MARDKPEIKQNTSETIADAWATAKLYRCADCNEPGTVILLGRRHCVTRVHHNWCKTGGYINTYHKHLRRPFYEDIRRIA